MKMLSPREENELVSAIEQSIGLTHSGLSPNDAIAKVAADKKYGPEKISRMAEAFNKSKSVHVFKAASQDERANPFELANTQEILRSIYTPTEKTAAVFALPSFSKDALFEESHKALRQADEAAALDMFAKTASDHLQTAPSSKKELTAEEVSTCDRLLKQACLEKTAVTSKLKEELRMKIQFHKMAFERALDEVCEHLAPLTPRGLRKVAQYIVNGYPTTGKGLLDIIEYKARVDFPEMTKTANCVCFPTQEPYVTINRLYTAAENMAKAETEMALFVDKEAASGEFGSNFAANALANFLAGAGVSSDKIVDAMSARKHVKTVEEELLDADQFNEMKGQEAKRTFILLSLYHPELKAYGHGELLKAYNAAVSTVPEAYNKPEILSSLMIKNIQSSGLKDPFELKTEADISKGLRDQQRDQASDELAQKERLEAQRPERPTALQGSLGVRNIADSAGRAIKSSASLAADVLTSSDKKAPAKMPAPAPANNTGAPPNII